MRVVDVNSIPNLETKTIQELGAVLGAKPAMASAVVTLYPKLSLAKLTEQLGAVYKTKVKDEKEIKSFCFEWMIKTNQIPRIKFAEDCNETGEGVSEFAVILEKKFYDHRDVFELENKQQLFVTRVPEVLAPGKVRHYVKLVTSNPESIVSVAAMTRGKATLYLSNYQPELHDKGYSKDMFNFEKHRNYISRHRVGQSWSGDYAKMADTYLEHNNMYFKLKDKEKDMLDQLMLAKESSQLLAEGNVTADGRVLIQEEDGRVIPIGEGVIPQIRRFAGQQRYSSLSVSHLRAAISDVVQKLEKKTGNTLVALVNWEFYQDMNELLDELLKVRTTDAYFYTKTGGKIGVGAHYNAYEFSGNKIVFMENQALTDRYADRGYCLILDAGVYDGEPNIQAHTIEGMQLVVGTLQGIGGKTGSANNDNLGSMIHGHRTEAFSYSGIKVANPYGAHIIEEYAAA